jgi:hypothetical protein
LIVFDSGLQSTCNEENAGRATGSSQATKAEQDAKKEELLHFQLSPSRENIFAQVGSRVQKKSIWPFR